MNQRNEGRNQIGLSREARFSCCSAVLARTQTRVTAAALRFRGHRVLNRQFLANYGYLFERGAATMFLSPCWIRTESAEQRKHGPRRCPRPAFFGRAIFERNDVCE